MIKTRIIQFILAIFLLLSGLSMFISRAGATCGDTTKWGIHSGSSSSNAGLVVYTKLSDGTFVNVSFTLDASANAIDYTPGGTWKSSESSRGVSTGSTYSDGSSNCTTTGALVLGYGTSNSQGNSYSLDCHNSSGQTNTFSFSNIAAPSGHSSGSWSGSGVGSSFSVSNGNTTTITLTWTDSGGNPGGSPTNNNMPEIHFDGVDCNGVYGWAKDADSPNSAVQIHIYIDGNNVAQIYAGDYRSDVGYHGYAWNMPSQYQNSSSHTVTTWAINIDSNGNANGSNPQSTEGQKSFGPCDKPPTGTVVSINCSTATGNVSDPDWSGSLQIRVSITGNGVNYGDSNLYGSPNFTYYIPDQYKNNLSYTIQFYVYSKDSSGNQPGNSVLLSGPSSFGPCDSNPPTLNITIDCTNQKVILKSNDADTSNPYPIYYSLGGGSYQNPNGPTVTLDMPAKGYDGYSTVSVDAYTYGRRNDGAEATGSSRVSRSATYGISGTKACKTRNFTIDVANSDPKASVNLNDDESPTSATIGGGFTLSFTSGPSGGQVSLSGTYNYYTIKSGTQTAASNSNFNGTYSAGTISTPQYSYILPSGLNAGDQVCATLTIDPYMGAAYSDGGVVPGSTPSPSNKVSTPPTCKYVVNRPYVKAFSGDIMAGGGFGSCLAQNATVKVSGSNLYGTIASNEQGVFANSSSSPGIIGFASAALNASYGTIPSNDGFDADQYKPGSCLSDFLGGEPSTVTKISDGPGLVTTLTGAQGSALDTYEVPSGSDLGTVTLPLGRRAVVYVKGTLTISGNITYASADSRGSLANIQSLYIIAKHINIKNAVTNLDGVYIAQPAGGDGVIDTCAEYAPNSAYTNCNKPLFVYGSLIAQKINFHRTKNSLRDGQNNGGLGESSGTSRAAEVIRFTPEIFLLPTPPGGSGSTTYDAFTDLPPNL